MKKAYLITLTVVVVIFALTGCVIQTGNTDGKTGIQMSGSGGVESIPDTMQRRGVRLSLNLRQTRQRGIPGR